MRDEGGDIFSISWGLHNSAGPVMQPQAPRAATTTTQLTKQLGCRPGSTGDGVKVHSLILPQLKDKF